VSIKSFFFFSFISCGLKNLEEKVLECLSCGCTSLLLNNTIPQYWHLNEQSFWILFGFVMDDILEFLVSFLILILNSFSLLALSFLIILINNQNSTRNYSNKYNVPLLLAIVSSSNFAIFIKSIQIVLYPT
jgi:hypothetical protein